MMLAENVLQSTGINGLKEPDEEYRQQRYCLTVLSNALHVNNIMIAEASVGITGEKKVRLVWLEIEAFLSWEFPSKRTWQDWKRSNSSCLKS